jgi:hypothetical protein
MRNGAVWGRALRGRLIIIIRALIGLTNLVVCSGGRRAGRRFVVGRFDGGFVVRVWDDHDGREKRCEGIK